MKTIERKILLILLLAVGLLYGLTSCKREYLTPKPLSFYEPTLTYVDAAAMKAALVACSRNSRIEYY